MSTVAEQICAVLPEHFLQRDAFVCYLGGCGRWRHGQHIYCRRHWSLLSADHKRDVATLQFAMATAILCGDQAGYEIATAAAEDYLRLIGPELQAFDHPLREPPV